MNVSPTHTATPEENSNTKLQTQLIFHNKASEDEKMNTI